MQQVYSPYQQYQRQKDVEVRTATPVKLIGMLLEGAILFNKKAMAAMDTAQKVKALENVDRSMKIVVHLYNCLDFDKGGEISERLAALYSYILEQFVVFMKGGCKNETLESINKILGIILDGWKQIEGAPQNAKPDQNPV